ncbi:MAG: anaerobic ribonucleoside-triphosphate reductase activating protein [Clostridia bacterium]|nr:anaerobic ribonucleoside-triphosphate reductase activating protein [Clostridia bacterium]
MNYATIKYNDIANGTGVRTSLFVSGCTHKCKGCFNAEAWDFNYGLPYTKEVEDNIIASLNSPFIDGLSLLGGEPFEPQNQPALLSLLKRFKETYPNKTVWCYTGYLFDEELLKPSRATTEHTLQMLSLIDVLVDGRFEMDKKNLMLKFRGSTNQRIIDVQKSLKEKTVVLHDVDKW